MQMPDDGPAGNGARDPQRRTAGTVAADRLPSVIRDAIGELIEYNRAAEEADYAECGDGGNSRRDHIRVRIALLSHWLGNGDDQEATGPVPAALKTLAADVGTQIDSIAGACAQPREAGAGPRAALADAARRLEPLAEKTAAMTGKADPQTAWRLLRLASVISDSGVIAGLSDPAVYGWLLDGIGLVQRAIQTHEDSVTVEMAQTFASVRGCMAGRCDPRVLNKDLGVLGAAAGLNLACVWDSHDSAGTGGNARLYVVDDDGQMREPAGNLREWLSDPGSAVSPGNPGTWTGPPAGFTVGDLPYHDGACNYAKQDIPGPGQLKAGTEHERRTASPGWERGGGSRPSPAQAQGRGQQTGPGRTAHQERGNHVAR